MEYLPSENNTLGITYGDYFIIAFANIAKIIDKKNNFKDYSLVSCTTAFIYFYYIVPFQFSS